MRFDFERTPQRDIYNLMIGLVAPRPIAWVTSMGADGIVNAAPFSAFNYLCIDPPIVGIGVAPKIPGSTERKDTARNIETRGEFVVNVVTEDLAPAMNACAVDFPGGVGELDMAGLHAEASAVVGVPRIREAHAALECRLFQLIKPKGASIILGRVVAAYVEDRFVDPKGPYILAQDLHALGRMNGAGNYVRTRDAFLKMPRLSLDDWNQGGRPKAPETAG